MRQGKKRATQQKRTIVLSAVEALRPRERLDASCRVWGLGLACAVLDIIPTGEAFRRADMAFGLGFWHWFFLAQPFPLPEQLIGSNPDNYYFRSGREQFDPEALADYLRCCHNPETIHAMCEDYRAGATIDYQLDEADLGKKRIDCPVLVLFVLETPSLAIARDRLGRERRGEAVGEGPERCHKPYYYPSSRSLASDV